MIFNKKDGSVRKNYKEACELILNAKLHMAEITQNRGKKFVKKYECYQIIFPYNLSNKKKRDCEEKIKLMCNEFGYKTCTWYSSGIHSMHILSDNIDEMIHSIEKSMNKNE